MTETEERQQLVDELERQDLIQQLQGYDAREGDMRKVDPPGATLGTKAAQVLNFLPGVTRASVKNVIDSVKKGKLNTVSDEDFNKAMTGKQPTSSEMYGVDPVTGFGLDVLQDPTMLVAGPLLRALFKGASAGSTALRGILHADQALPTVMSDPSLFTRGVIAADQATKAPGAMAAASRPLSGALRGAGRAMYGASLRPLEQASPGVTQDLFDAGVKGTASGMGDKVTNLISSLEDQNAEIAGRASHVLPNQPVSLKRAMEPVRAKAAELSKSPIDLPAVNNFLPTIDAYENVGNASVRDALFQQSRLRTAAKEAYREGVGASAKAQLAQAGNRGYRGAIMDAMAQGPKDIAPLTAQYGDNTQKLGRLIEAEKAAQGMRSPPLLTSRSAAAGAAGLFTGGPMAASTWALLTRALEGLSGPTVGTYGGRALYRAGQTGLAEPMLIQGAVHAGSPWALLNEEKK